MSDAALGLLLAFTTLFCWGFGDFFIQESTRRVGVWKSLFFNDLFAVLVLSPFIYKELFTLSVWSFLLLTVLSIIVIFAAVFDFTALKEGKIAIIEPLLGIELPITVGLSVILLQEQLTALEFMLIGLVFIGVMLAAATRLSHLSYHRRLLEKGVLLAGLGAIALGLMNFLVGVSSRDTSPLLTVWFFSAVLVLVSTFHLTLRKEWGSVGKALRQNFGITAKQSVVDNAGWIAYAGATTYLPISIVTSITESYIALAVILGIFVNREKLKPHQYLGVLLAVIAVIALAALAG